MSTPVFVLIISLLMVATGLLSALRTALKENLLHEEPGFFYHSFNNYFFSANPQNSLIIAATVTLNFSRFFSIFMTILFFDEIGLKSLIFLFFLLPLLLLMVEFLPALVERKYGWGFPRVLLFCLSSLMLLSFPLTYLIRRLSRESSDEDHQPRDLSKAKKEIIEIIQKLKVASTISNNEKKLIEAAIKFNDRIAKEVMVPRVDVFSLPHDTTIREAIKLIEEEGYSRIPIYRSSVDNIVGVLMYKDLLRKLREYIEKGNDPLVLDAPIESVQKEILYTPQTTKISNLLLEFKKKQLHLAIVVDEYGGTEGIVSIEDILEEIVGDIEDEYDEEEELFFPQKDGSFIADARLSILDAEQQLGIKIPQEGDYDTIGGFVFHCTGSIPEKGFVIHRDRFRIEILQSDEKSVKRVKIRSIVEDETKKEPSNGEKEK